MPYDFNEEAQRIGERIIPEWHPHLIDVKIAYITKEATSKSTKAPRGGKALKLGSASTVSEKHKLLAGRDYEFVIEITGHYWDKLSLPQQEALVDHELCHCRKDGDGFYLANHDLEEFRQILRRHGFWKPDIQAFCEEAQPLFDKPGAQRRFTSTSLIEPVHQKFGVQILAKPEIPDIERQTLRRKLIKEEYEEFIEAWADDSLVEIADSLADMIYVILGTALSYGIPLDLVFEEVQRTNMAKERGGTRDDGKILKPAGWQPPDIAGILERAGP